MRDRLIEGSGAPNFIAESLPISGSVYSSPRRGSEFIVVEPLESESNRLVSLIAALCYPKIEPNNYFVTSYFPMQKKKTLNNVNSWLSFIFSMS